MTSLAGKTAIVTGGSQGIGAGIVRKFAERGANVIFSYVTNKIAAEKLINEIEPLGARVFAVKTDVTDSSQLESLFDKANGEFGPLDILVNNAGVFTFDAIGATEIAEVNRLFTTNVFAPMFAIKSALKNFRDGGTIINIGSIVSTMAPPNSVAYSSSKAAVDAITKVLSKELAPRRITVN